MGVITMPVARKVAKKVPSGGAPGPKKPAPPKTSPTAAPEPVDDNLVHQAYSRIEELIVTLKLVPGQVISENMLSAMLGLGRTPVREAFQHLAREGLVLILPRRGIIVAEIDVRKQLRLLELRRSVEGCVAGLAARRANEEQRQRFAELADEMDRVGKANDGQAFLALDAEFNRLLLQAARNEYAAAAMKLMQGLSRRFWYAHYRSVADLPETVRLHAGIARAIAKHDAAEAQRWLDKLLDNVEAFTRATLDADPVY